MLPEPLANAVKEFSPNANLAEIERAYDFAAKAHAGQKRASGEPYIGHAAETARTLAKLRLSQDIIIAGMLHDVPEDTSVTLGEIEAGFGKDVAGMVSGITKLGKIKYRGMDRYVENMRKLFVAMASDIRTIIIKFADRLHNLETLGALPEEKRRRIAIESLDVFAPIANRLGMGEIQGRLEDLSFRYVHPKEYEWIQGIIKDRYAEKEQYVARIGDKIKKTLAQHGVGTARIYGRTKHIYSLWKKLLKHDRDITKVHDVMALRVIVPTVGDCYAALGVIHELWKPLKGRIKDYIALPKPNGYRSLHTTVFCDDGEIVEVQIRTEQMHEESEYGIAAHWHYAELGKESRAQLDKQLAWVKDLLKLKSETLEGETLLESLEVAKLNVFNKRIFVFTPQGDVLDLPEDSTPVDFAYAVHSDIGDKCTGARINGNMAKLDAKLYSGDMCAILVDKNRKTPNPDWLEFVKTHHAKDRIRACAKSNQKSWLKQILPGSRK